MYVFAGSRGGATRARIVHAVLETPKNNHQLAKELGLDYKTVQYNLRVLDKHRYLVTVTEGYGTLWAPSKNLLAVADQFQAICADLDLGKPTNTDNPE